MNKTLSILSLALLLGSAPSAQAQSGGQVVLSGGLVFAQGNAQDLTHKTAGGYGAEIGYQFSPKDYGVDFLVYGGWKKLPAGQPTDAYQTYQLAGPHAGFDLVYTPWEKLPIKLSTGPSVHVWQVEQIGLSNGNMGDQGPKLGWRAGISYAFKPQWDVTLRYTFTEWKSNPDVDIPRRPAYFSLMVGYRF